jgi:hypothetical protein
VEFLASENIPVSISTGVSEAVGVELLDSYCREIW